MFSTFALDRYSLANNCYGDDGAFFKCPSTPFSKQAF